MSKSYFNTLESKLVLSEYYKTYLYSFIIFALCLNKLGLGYLIVYGVVTYMYPTMKLMIHVTMKSLKEQCHISHKFYFFIFLLFYEFLVDSA